MKRDYSSWVDEVYQQKEADRVGVTNAILDAFAKKSEKAEQLADSIADLKEFEKPSFLTHVHAVPIKGGSPGIIEHMMFAEPVLAVKHKRLPLVLAIGKSNKVFPKRGYEETMASIDDDFDLKQVLSWIEVVSYFSDSEKKELANLVIEGIRDQRPTRANPVKKEYRKNLVDTKKIEALAAQADVGKKQDQWLSDFLAKGKEFEIAGFAGNDPYINIDRAFGDTKPIWVHPWGIPTLLLKHRELPAIMMVSPAIRLNENLLGSRNMEGYTG